jgi:GAF domain-containing protein
VALYAALNRRDFDGYARLLADDVVATINASTVVGREAVTDYVAATVKEMPSLRVEVEILAETPELVVSSIEMINAEDAIGPGAELPWRLEGRSRQIFVMNGDHIAEIITTYTPQPTDRMDLLSLPLRTEAAMVLEEQAALRRVAELAARDAPPSVVFEAVVSEAAKLVGVAFTTLLRFEPDGATEVVAIHDPPPGVTVGMRASGDGDGATQRAWSTRRTARVDRLAEMSGHWPQVASRSGYSSSAAAPILAEDRLWGVLVAAGLGPLPASIEVQLARFAQLAGTAISSARARAALQTLADEQAALRRVAELVARDAEPQTVLDAVAGEASGLFGDTVTALMRYGADGFATVVATSGAPRMLGLRIPLEGRSSTADVARTGRPSRTDDYATSDNREIAAAHGVAATVSVPIVVEDAVWGSLTVGSGDGPLPDGLEERAAQFASLAGTAISSAHALDRLRRLVDEQSALRRVAELVARGVGQEQLFELVTIEASRLVDGFAATLVRLDAPHHWTVLASHGGPAPVGTRLTISHDDEGLLANVYRNGRPARQEDFATLAGPSWARDDFGVRSSVAVPIFLDTRLWGALGITSADVALPGEA